MKAKNVSEKAAFILQNMHKVRVMPGQEIFITDRDLRHSGTTRRFFKFWNGEEEPETKATPPSEPQEPEAKVDEQIKKSAEQEDPNANPEQKQEALPQEKPEEPESAPAEQGSEEVSETETEPEVSGGSEKESTPGDDSPSDQPEQSEEEDK